MVNNLDEANVLRYLQQFYPHLYDVQMQVKKVAGNSGYGDVSVVLYITEGVVDRGEILGSSKKIYYRRIGNQLKRIDTEL